MSKSSRWVAGGLCGVALLIVMTCVAAAGGFAIGRLGRDGESHYEEGVVSRVIDGDTIELTDGRRVRCIGIYTHEIAGSDGSPECYVHEAHARNRELVEGKTVELGRGIEDKDRFSRLLRYVFVDDVFVNAQLVAEGYAYASSFGPEHRFQQVLTQLEHYSRLRNRGLGDACE
ncbi:MAG: thermonuclease family protein [bacterium]